MNKRLDGYFRALEDGTLERYHDYHDVHKGKLSVDDYERKHGRYTGFYSGRRHVR